MNINGLIEKIAEKKGLQGVSKDSINSFLSIYLKKHKIKEQNIESLSEKEIKSIVKDARAHLRILVGRFHLKESKKNNLLKKKDWAGLLNTHTSTKERIDIYPEILSLFQFLSLCFELSQSASLRNPGHLLPSSIQFPCISL